MKPIIEVYPDAGGGYRFRIRAANKEIIAVSESYTRREDAARGANSLIDVAVTLNTVRSRYGADSIVTFTVV